MRSTMASLAQLSRPVVRLANGHDMPLLGLGTYQMKSPDCENAVKAALTCGYRHIDTAAIYRNETFVADTIALSSVPRVDIFITSKLKPQDHGEGAYAACLQTLENLRIDYIDLYLVHWPGAAGMSLSDHAGQAAKRKATWLALQRIVTEGKARAIGVSNYMPAHLEELCGAEWCTVKPAVNQFELHPLLQQRDAVAACQKWGVQVEAYSSIARGAPELLECDVVKDAASAHGVTPAQVCLRWAVQKGYCVIPKSVNSHRIQTNADIFDWTLTKDEMDALDGLDKGFRTCWDPTRVA